MKGLNTVWARRRTAEILKRQERNLTAPHKEARQAKGPAQPPHRELALGSLRGGMPCNRLEDAKQSAGGAGQQAAMPLTAD